MYPLAPREAEASRTPTAAATTFRVGRRSHRGRLGRRSQRGRVGLCSTSSEAVSPDSAASRNLERRARAASARASASATSSSAASASGLSGSCTENELITLLQPQRCRRAAEIVALTCGNARPAASEAEWVRWPSADRRLIQAIFSNQENFRFGYGTVIACYPPWQW